MPAARPVRVAASRTVLTSLLSDMVVYICEKNYSSSSSSHARRLYAFGRKGLLFIFFLSTRGGRNISSMAPNVKIVHWLRIRYYYKSSIGHKALVSREQLFQSCFWAWFYILCKRISIHGAKIATWLLLRLRCPSFAGSRVSPFADNKRPERRQSGLLCQEANIRWLRRCCSLFAQRELLMFSGFNFFPVATRPGFFRSFVSRTFGKICLGASSGASAGASDFSAKLYMIRWKFLQSICRFLVSFIARFLDRLLCRFLLRFFNKIDVLGCD